MLVSDLDACEPVQVLWWYRNFAEFTTIEVERARREKFLCT